MTPYNHLRSQHCNASWRRPFMYIAKLAPHTTFNQDPETTFQVYKHFDI